LIPHKNVFNKRYIIVIDNSQNPPQIEFRTEVYKFRTDFNEFRTEVDEFRTDFDEFRTEVNEFRTDFNKFCTEADEFCTDFEEFRTDLLFNPDFRLFRV